MKRQIKRLLKTIDTDRANGRIFDNKTYADIQAYWIRLFGDGGHYYPYTDLNDMINDLREYVK